MTERLHNVIETQWQKTLEILTTNDKDSNKLISNRILNDLDKCEKNNCSSWLKRQKWSKRIDVIISDYNLCTFIHEICLFLINFFI